MAIDLSTIATGARLKPPKIVLYGVGGIGKTTFAAHAPKPIFMFTEEGQGLLDIPRFEPRPEDPILRSWQEIMDCVSALYDNEHDYETAILDTIDFAEPLLWKHTAAKYRQNDIESFGYGKGYIYAVDEARVLLEGLDALRTKKNMAVIVIAHSETRKFEAPEAESYDRYELRLHKRLANYVHDWADAMLFANYKISIVKDKEGFNKERKRAVGQGERFIYTQERPHFAAKNRYGLPYELPLSWQAFQDSIVPPPVPATKSAVLKQPAKAGKE